MKPQHIGVVITTYNQPKWLRKVLFGYEAQRDHHFTVIVADDGSGQPTREVIEFFQARGILRLQHIWHEDKGFQKCQILNKAIAQTECDYLIFTDGDCIPEPDFVEIHRNLARPRQFLSGGYIKLTTPVSEAISEADIASGVIFDTRWLKQAGQPASHKLWKLIKNKLIKAVLNAVTPTKATWNGMNSSTWTADIKACNGFNEDMQYGGLDRELGERLQNYGLKGKQVRYSVNCLHLDHPRAYDNPETWKKNYAIRNEVKRTGRYWATNGIVKQSITTP
ncbi:glycosyltransferase family 2 protein [Cellvibrio japonicus]|nr:glycosyltransferase family 2 protein [Cellvibrio japonicus]QEI11943.1 glycosyltransferase [Cellvibrio japonicus]QEI15517.1 glycosyltransferase [Cellvibrio japonicus]QEI19096.1 glycosyltransferase [Cellvibrio japonicus]